MNFSDFCNHEVCGCHEVLRQANEMTPLKKPKYDKAFALLAVCLPDELYEKDHEYLVQKLSELENKDLFLWGPEAALMSEKIYQEVQASCGVYLQNIKNAFFIPATEQETFIVNKKKIEINLKSCAVKFLQSFDNIEDFLEEILKTVFDKSVSQLDYDEDETEIQRASLDEQWKNFMVNAMKDHLREKFGQFPEQILGSYVAKLIDLFLNSKDTHLVDRLQLAERLNTLMELPKDYFSMLSDVTAGRIWSFAAIQQAADKGYIEYQINGYMDAKICNVCFILNGKRFSTTSIFKKMALFLDDPNDDDMQKLLFPFPKNSDVGGRTILPDEGFLPPFHPNCRCTITLLRQALDKENKPVLTPLQMIKRLNQSPAALKNIKAVELAAREITDKLLVLDNKSLTEMEILVEKAGKIKLSSDQKAALEDKVLLKSSVNNELFNTDNFNLLISNKAKELTLVTKTHKYKLKVDWDFATSEIAGALTAEKMLSLVKKAFSTNLKELAAKYESKVALGEMSAEEAKEKISHLAMRYTAQEFAWLTYSKTLLEESN